MSVTVTSGDLFDDPAECLVNAVNAVGVMGGGIAAEFKRRWPAMYREYREACFSGDCGIGRVHLWQHPYGCWWIANLATKADWRDGSEPDYIRWGLDDLVRRCEELDIESVAMPALGCGLGGLGFDEVLPLIEEAFAGSAVKVTVYRPQGAGRR